MALSVIVGVRGTAILRRKNMTRSAKARGYFNANMVVVNRELPGRVSSYKVFCRSYTINGRMAFAHLFPRNAEIPYVSNGRYETRILCADGTHYVGNISQLSFSGRRTGSNKCLKATGYFYTLD
jgi:hypothetical protein